VPQATENSHADFICRANPLDTMSFVDRPVLVISMLLDHLLQDLRCLQSYQRLVQNLKVENPGQT
jgi:hypothetical protein